MLAGAFSPVSRSPQRGQALRMPMHMQEAAPSSPLPAAALRDSHFSSQRHAEMLYYPYTNSAICASGAGSPKGRCKLITKKGLNTIARANVLKASPP